jgi:beta-N-acetylhexosaminidase
MPVRYTWRMHRKSVRISAWIIFCATFSLAFAHPPQGGTPPEVINNFERMTTEEKIGQLFMVTFQGKDITPGSDIEQLIADYHIGGVLLERQNGNWHSGAGEAAAVVTLTNGLQQIAADTFAAAGSGVYIPLFAAINGGGDGYPSSELITDLTDIPSEMTIGATWQPSFAQEIGAIIGREFSLLGINMYFGPSLDVLESPHPGTTGDLGARTFGGDPFWVGKMGQAYIQGIQDGAGRKIAVIATHFPGIGASDRSPEQEVATIRKAMQDLRLIDLSPFALAAAAAPGVAGVADGFMVSHIRYQGLQGNNIRTSTRPVSLDPQALNQLMALPEFTAWREGGGITVTSSLGDQSMRKFYESIGATYSDKLVAYNAFKAGNDILQLSNVASQEGQTELQADIETIKYFQQTYATDADFAAKVDQAVLRILTLKNRLYPGFNLSSVLRSEAVDEALKTGDPAPAEVCKAGATLLSPNPLASGGPEVVPPSSADRLLVLTDSRLITPCPGCTAESDISPGVFADTVLRLYGPGASGLIHPARLQSYSFRDLYGYLHGVPLPDLDVALKNATVLVILLRTPNPAVPESYVFQELLGEQQALIRNKRIFVFALGAPYYLDSTEISKIDAYYALYSKHAACIEAGARLLFGDLTPAGSSPVSVEGVNYNLLTVLSPDPDQVLQISAGLSGAETPTAAPGGATQTVTITSTATPLGFSLGDSITFTAGPVLDHNRHIVPDGTGLQFKISYPQENIPALTLDTTTVNGLAQVDYVLDRAGEMQVSATSEPAKNSTIIQLTVGEQPGFITAIAPTEAAKETPSLAATPTRTGEEGGGSDAGGQKTGWDTLLAMLAGMGVFSAALYGLTNTPDGIRLRWRILLAGVVGGLAGYDLVSVPLAGVSSAEIWGGRWMSVAAGAAGMLIGAGLAWGSAAWKKWPWLRE